MTEIEIRGRLAKVDFERVFKLMEDKSVLTDHYQRLSVDLSPGFEAESKTWKNPSGTDIRLKKSDGKEKLSIKTGNYNDLERKEVEVKLETGQFLNALEMLETMGYKTGMIYFWESWEFEYSGVEIKLSKYTDKYFTFEIEGKTNQNVEEVARDLGLTAYSNEEYRKAIDWENQNIHQLYDKNLAERILQERF
jgi:hypothetical protein